MGSLIKRREPEQAEPFLAYLIEHGRGLRARPNQDRRFVVEEIKKLADGQGRLDLAVLAMGEIWPLNGKHIAPAMGEQMHQGPATSQIKEQQPKSLIPPRGDKGFKFEWQRAFRAVRDTSRETGLPALTRLVMWEVSGHMNGDGTSARPGQERIAKAAGLSLPAAKFHLQLAVERGWLKRARTYSSRFGLGYEYLPTIPGVEGATTVPGSNVSQSKNVAAGNDGSRQARKREGATS